MKLFVAAVDEGSLAAAARRHGRSAASVTRAVALLEEDAGERLMLRSTRQLGLTVAGERRLLIWRDVLAKLSEIQSETGSALQGSIVLTAPELFGRLHVMPLVEQFMAGHPQISMRVLLVNRLVNMIGEGIDLAIRLAPLPDSTLIALRIGEVGTRLCAAPHYLENAGIPDRLAALQHHACIGLNAESDGELWSFEMGEGRETRLRSVRVSTRLSVSNAAAAIDAAIRGHGIIQARSYQVADHIAQGRLIRLLPQLEAPAVPAHIVFPADRTRNKATRAFIDYATSPLKRALLAAQ